MSFFQSFKLFCFVQNAAGPGPPATTARIVGAPLLLLSPLTGGGGRQHPTPTTTATAAGVPAGPGLLRHWCISCGCPSTAAAGGRQHQPRHGVDAGCGATE